MTHYQELPQALMKEKHQGQTLTKEEVKVQTAHDLGVENVSKGRICHSREQRRLFHRGCVPSEHPRKRQEPLVLCASAAGYKGEQDLLSCGQQ